MASDDTGTDEERERYRELLEELRTIIPGVQVLFAFMLTAPFSARFEAVDDLGVQIFAVALLAVGAAAVVLMTPAAYHRVSPHTPRAQRLRLGARATIIGMALLANGMVAALLVVGRFVFTTAPAPPTPALPSTAIAVGIAGVTGVLAVALWFVLPLVRRLTRDRGPDG